MNPLQESINLLDKENTDLRRRLVELQLIVADLQEQMEKQADENSNVVAKLAESERAAGAVAQFARKLMGWRQEDHEPHDGACDRCAFAALASNAGRGWHSPEEYERLEAEAAAMRQAGGKAVAKLDQLTGYDAERCLEGRALMSAITCTNAGRSYRSPESFASERQAILAENERLEAACAAWSRAWDDVRDCVLNGRHQLAESEHEYAPNDVLGVMDDRRPVYDFSRSLLAELERLRQNNAQGDAFAHVAADRIEELEKQLEAAESDRDRLLALVRDVWSYASGDCLKGPLQETEEQAEAEGETYADLYRRVKSLIGR